MRRLILLTVLIVAFCAMPAFASTQNVKVDGDLDSTLVIRNDFDLGLALNGGFEQNLFITQTRVGISADLTDNVGVKIKLINERPWGEDTGSANTDVDLNEAYAQFREFIYSPATLTVGLQPLRFGNALIIGDPNTNNRVSSQSALSGVAADLSKEKAFDAARLTLDYNPLTIDIFAAKADSNTLVGAQQNDDDVDVLGWNNNYKFGDKHNTEAEVYFFAKVDNSTDEALTGGDPDTVYTPGARVSTNVLGLNLQGELAMQRGNKAVVTSGPSNQSREAWAGQVIASHQIAAEKTKKYNPVVAMWGTWLSGDSNATANSPVANPTPASGEKWTAWDPMFEDQSGGTIYNTLFDYSNVRLLGGSLSFNPMEDVMVKTTYTGLWLDKNVVDPTGQGTIAIRQPDGTTTLLSGIQATSNYHLGNELDVDVVYNYSEDVQFGATAGWFFPGQVFDAPFGTPNGNDEVASQFLLNADVAF